MLHRKMRHITYAGLLLFLSARRTETASKKRRRSSVTCKNVSSKPDLSSEIKDTSPSKLQSLLLNSAASSCSFYKLLQDTTVKLSNKPSINLYDCFVVKRCSSIYVFVTVEARVF